jgi:hypothetical protein
VLDAVRASRLTTRLAQVGSPLVLPKGEQPGLAMGLGGVGVTLANLTRLYAGLARQGTTVPLVERCAGAAAELPQRLLDPVIGRRRDHWHGHRAGAVCVGEAARYCACCEPDRWHLVDRHTGDDQRFCSGGIAPPRRVCSALRGVGRKAIRIRL